MAEPIRPHEIGQTVTATQVIEPSDSAARWLKCPGKVINRWWYDSAFIRKHKLSGLMYEVQFQDGTRTVTFPFYHEELQEN